VLDNTLWYGILNNRNQDTHKLENLSYYRALIDNDNNNKIILDYSLLLVVASSFTIEPRLCKVCLLMEPGPKERITAASESLVIIDSVR